MTSAQRCRRRSGHSGPVAPRTLMFIRHAEKPADHGTPLGVDRHGQQDGHSLSVRGWTRAGALAALFDHAADRGDRAVVRPGRVLATRPTDGYRSTRERDTAEPTASRLGLTVDDSFTHQQVAEAAAALLADDTDALVVWHHGSLPAFLAHLPLSDPASVPAAWPEERFDLIWSLTDDGSGHYLFQQVPQDLLSGDAAPA
jgi:hypothetical protein